MQTAQLADRRGLCTTGGRGRGGNHRPRCCAHARFNPRYFYESFSKLDDLLLSVYKGLFEMPAAAIDNDADRLLAVLVEQGFFRADEPPPPDKMLEWCRRNFAAMHQPQPFTFTPEFVAETFGHLVSMDSELMRLATVPKDFVFTNRIFVGLYSILGALRATADWMAIFLEDVSGEPTTELGRLDAEFFAGPGPNI